MTWALCGFRAQGLGFISSKLTKVQDLKLGGVWSSGKFRAQGLMFDVEVLRCRSFWFRRLEGLLGLWFRPFCAWGPTFSSPKQAWNLKMGPLWIIVL